MAPLESWELTTGGLGQRDQLRWGREREAGSWVLSEKRQPRWRIEGGQGSCLLKRRKKLITNREGLRKATLCSPTLWSGAVIECESKQPGLKPQWCHCWLCGLWKLTQCHCLHLLCALLCSITSDSFATPQGSSVHGIFQSRTLKWVAISYSRGSSWLRDPTYVSCVSCIGRQILYHCAAIARSLSNTLVKVILNLKEFSLSTFPWRSFLTVAQAAILEKWVSSEFSQFALLCLKSYMR